MRTAFKCRAYPTEEQAVNLSRTFGCARKVWNEILDWRTKRYRVDGIKTNYAQADGHLTRIKRTPELAFLNEVSAVPLQQALRHQYRALNNYFEKRAKYPRFKSRRGRQSATYTKCAFRYRDGDLFLAKQSESLRFVWSWPGIDPAGIDPSTVNVSHDPDGMWYVTFMLDVAEPEPLPATGAAVGIDVGLNTFATCSDGEIISNQRFLERKLRNLARYQRRMARKLDGSSNRAKAKRKVAVAHGKVHRARQDFLQKTTTRLVEENDVVVVEDLNVCGMIRNKRLARAISDCGWWEFRRQLSYKTERYGRELVVIDRWFPSSKCCSTCGHLLAQLSLKTRHWQCPSCGTRHDRDFNAATNILAEGLSVHAGATRRVSLRSGCKTGPATGRRSAKPPKREKKQETQPAMAGIPAL